MKKIIMVLYGIFIISDIWGQEPIENVIHVSLLDENLHLVEDTNRFKIVIRKKEWEIPIKSVIYFDNYNFSGKLLSEYERNWSFMIEWRSGLGFYEDSLRARNQTLYDFRLYFIDKQHLQDTMIISVVETDSIPTGNKPWVQLRLPPFQKGSFEVCALDNVKINHKAVNFYNKYAKQYEYKFENVRYNPSADKPGIWDITPQMWIKKE